MNWQTQVEEILTQAEVQQKAISFLELVDKVNPDPPPPEWQAVFNDIFRVLSEQYSPWQLYPLVFKWGMVWQQYRAELEKEV